MFPRSEQKRQLLTRDRKSTRLNSSHSQISYAVFCLKKKKKNQICDGERERSQRNTARLAYGHLEDPVAASRCYQRESPHPNEHTREPDSRSKLTLL